MNDLPTEVKSTEVSEKVKPTEVIISEKTKLKKKWTGKARPVKFTPKRQKQFLELLAKSCNLKQTALAMGIAPSTIYKYKHDDPKFKEALLATQEAAFDYLEASVMDRATNGSKKGVYWQGEKIAEEVVHHDSLAMYLLSHNMDKYRNTTQIELTGKNGGPIELSAAKNKLLDILGVTLEGEFEEE